MLEALRSNVRVLKGGRPGSRFQDLRRHRRRQSGTRGNLSRVLLLGLGIVLLLVTPVVGLIPGPGGIIVFALGAALLASESTIAARALDWCEPRARKLWLAVRKAWKRANVAARIAVCVAGVALLATCVAAYLWTTSSGS